MASLSQTRARRWFYLNGYFSTPDGGKTTNPGTHRFPPSAWNEYDASTSFLLSDQYDSMGLDTPGGACVCMCARARVFVNPVASGTSL